MGKKREEEKSLNLHILEERLLTVSKTGMWSWASRFILLYLSLSIFKRGACSKPGIVALAQHYYHHLWSACKTENSCEWFHHQASRLRGQSLRCRKTVRLRSPCSPRSLPDGKSVILRFHLILYTVPCISVSIEHFLPLEIKCRFTFQMRGFRVKNPPAVVPTKKSSFESRKASICSHEYSESEYHCWKMNVHDGCKLFLVVLCFSGLTTVVSPNVPSGASGFLLPAFSLSSVTANLGYLTFCFNFSFSICKWGNTEYLLHRVAVWNQKLQFVGTCSAQLAWVKHLTSISPLLNTLQLWNEGWCFFVADNMWMMCKCKGQCKILGELFSSWKVSYMCNNGPIDDLKEVTSHISW